MYKPKILVVEDDPAITNLIRTTLDTQEYQYHTARNGAGAILDAVSYNPDVIILDLGLPDMDGVEIIRKVRGWSNVPIIIVSARSEDQDKVEALDAGADDYLTKPFSIDEFLARLRVALRRSRADQTAAPVQSSLYRMGICALITRRGAPIWRERNSSDSIEYKLLCVLAKNTGKVLTHNYILKEVWGTALTADMPSLRVFMATLRKKIEQDPSAPKYIQTHIGVGYRMIRQ